MYSITKVYPGACQYTASNVIAHQKYAAYLSNFSIQVFKLSPLSCVGQRVAPRDLVNDGLGEASGVVAMTVSPDGMIAVSTYVGIVFTYTFDNLSRPQFSFNLNVGQHKASSDDEAGRRHQEVAIQAMEFDGRGNLICCDYLNQVIIRVNIQSSAVQLIKTMGRPNLVATYKDDIYVGIALNGTLAKLSRSQQNSKEMTETLLSASVAMPAVKELVFPFVIESDTIYNTPYLLYTKIGASTVIGLSTSEQSNQS